MRIIAGQFKGRALKAPKTRATRPTSDRARETLFNVLSHAEWATDMEGAHVLDVFAGSGALGFEAMSRGAARVVLVEQATPAQRAIKDNIAALKLGAQAKLLKRNASSLGAYDRQLEQPFDLVFLDPPYDKGLVEPCVQGLIDGGWLAQDCLIVAETGAKEDLNWQGLTVNGGCIECVKDKTSGAAKFWFLKSSEV